MHQRLRYLAHGAAALLVAALVSGCPVQFISLYDEQTDKAVTALQRKVDSFLVRLEGQSKPPECSHENHRRFYEEARVDLSGIQVRAGAIPQNEKTVEQLALLASSLGSLEKLHRLKSPQAACMDADELAPLRINFNTSFTAILKLELTKKRQAAP